MRKHWWSIPNPYSSARYIALSSEKPVVWWLRWAVNVLFAWFLFGVSSPQPEFDTTALATSAFAFFLVMVLKVVAYSIQLFNYSVGDDA